MNLTKTLLLLLMVTSSVACRRENSPQTSDGLQPTPKTAYGAAVNQAKALNGVATDHDRVLEEESGE